MKVFEVKPDDDGFPYGYYIDAVHRWGLPGVRCPACGFTGGAVGVSYADLSQPVGVEPEPYEAHSPVAPSRVRELARPLRTLLAEDLPIPAGREFGPLCGKAESPPIIVASEQFVHATNDLRLTDIKFTELEVR